MVIWRELSTLTDVKLNERVCGVMYRSQAKREEGHLSFPFPSMKLRSVLHMCVSQAEPDSWSL